MATDIFIRTYSKDINWLKYCILSINKFVSGHRKLIVCIPQDEAHLLDDLKINGVIIGWQPVTKNGYVDQQINKLRAHTMTDADNILFIDSDCYFTRPTDISEYFIDGKPFLMKTRYELVGDAICWKAPTDKVLNGDFKYEYMRRMPLLFKRNTLQNLDQMVDVVTLANMEAVSEFNLLGAFADTYQKGEYHIIDTEIDSFPPSPVIQGWSWGGLTPGIENKMKELLCN